MQSLITHGNLILYWAMEVIEKGISKVCYFCRSCFCAELLHPSHRLHLLHDLMTE